MAKIGNYLSRDRGGSYRLTISIPQADAERTAKALELLMQHHFRKSKSQIVKEAILIYAELCRKERA